MKFFVCFALLAVVSAVTPKSALLKDLANLEADVERSLNTPAFLTVNEPVETQVCSGDGRTGRCTMSCSDEKSIFETDVSCEDASRVCCENGQKTEDSTDYSERSLGGVFCGSNAEPGKCMPTCARASVIWHPATASCRGATICCKSSYEDDDASASTGNESPETDETLPFQACDLKRFKTPFDAGYAYRHGARLAKTPCIKFDRGTHTTKTDVCVAQQIICPLYAMIDAATKDGFSFNINSGFRTNAEQQSLRDRNCRNGKCHPKTAPAGYSNHQNGIAVDIEVGSNPGLYTWLSKNAHHFGFIRAVSTETWHWEYHPGLRCNAIVSFTCQNSPRQGKGERPFAYTAASRNTTPVSTEPRACNPKPGHASGVCKPRRNCEASKIDFGRCPGETYCCLA